MRRTFQVLLVLFGLLVIAISLAHFAIGPSAIIGGVTVNPTMAGEDRFFAGLLLCYGIALLWCARDVEHKSLYIDVLAVAFFAGGIGRLLAILIDGAPHAFYVAMLVLELALPPLMVVVGRRVGEPVSA